MEVSTKYGDSTPQSSMWMVHCKPSVGIPTDTGRWGVLDMPRELSDAISRHEIPGDVEVRHLRILCVEHGDVFRSSWYIIDGPCEHPCSIAYRVEFGHNFGATALILFVMKLVMKSP